LYCRGSCISFRNGGNGRGYRASLDEFCGKNGGYERPYKRAIGQGPGTNNNEKFRSYLNRRACTGHCCPYHRVIRLPFTDRRDRRRLLLLLVGRLALSTAASEGKVKPWRSVRSYSTISPGKKNHSCACRASSSLCCRRPAPLKYNTDFPGPTGGILLKAKPNFVVRPNAARRSRLSPGI